MCLLSSLLLLKASMDSQSQTSQGLLSVRHFIFCRLSEHTCTVKCVEHIECVLKQVLKPDSITSEGSSRRGLVPPLLLLHGCSLSAVPASTGPYISAFKKMRRRLMSQFSSAPWVVFNDAYDFENWLPFIETDVVRTGSQPIVECL